MERGREVPGRHPSLHLPPTPAHSVSDLQIPAWVNWIQKRCWQKEVLFFFNLFNFGEPSPHPPNVPEPMGTGLGRTDY